MKVKYIVINALVIVILAFCNCNAFSQTNFKDSLFTLINSTQDESKKAFWLNEIASGYINSYKDSSIIFAERALYIAGQNGLTNEIAKSNSILAKSYFYLSDYPKSLEYHFSAIEYFDKLKDYNSLANEYYSVGLIYSASQNFNNAKLYYEKAIAQSRKINNNVQLSKSLLNLGWLYYNFKKDSNTALGYYNQVLKINEVLRNDYIEMKLQVRYGELYIDSRRYSEALEHYTKSANTALKINDQINYAFNTLIIGRIYYLVATDSLLDTKNNNLKGFPIGKNDNLKIAEKFTQQSIDLFDRIKDYDDMSAGYLFLSDIKFALGQYKEAYEYLNKRIVINDSIFNFNKDKKIAYIESQKEIAVRDAKLKETELQIKTKQEIIFAVVLIVIIISLALAAALALFFNKRKQSLVLEEKNAVISEVNASKDRFFSIIAHDLRNPVGAIKLSAEFIDENFQLFDDNDKHEFFTEIRKAATHIHSLLENLLTWARSQSGKIQFNPDLANINFLIGANVSLLKTHADNKSIKLIQECPESLECIIDVDMINTVLRNLLTNAIKFTNFAGEVKVIAKIENYKNGDYVKISIVDNGVGMSAENIDKLFRIDNSSSTPGTDKETGTGLGLILCKEFVEKHNGKIWVESELNKGSAFNFTLPYSKATDNQNQDELKKILPIQ